jgi:predicted N-acetyltransferase YhbS
MDCTIRRATVDDCDLLAAVIRAAFEEYRDELVPPSGAHNETAVTIASLLGRGGAFIAELGPETAGCVVFEPEDGDLYFGRLSVIPSARGSGLGRRLVETVEAEALLGGCPGVRLGVRLALPANRTFFEALGYEVTGTGTHTGFTEPTFLRMRKQLPASD